MTHEDDHTNEQAVDRREDLANATEDPFIIPVAPLLPVEAETDAPFATPGKIRIRRDGDTEDLLNGLIAECHHYMRAVVLPSTVRSTDVTTRQHFLRAAIDFARAGAHVAKSVAKLRTAAAITEQYERRVFESATRVLPAPENR